jgi:GTP cyclohydrolase I
MLPDRKARPPDRAAMEKAVADLLDACGAELDAETRELVIASQLDFHSMCPHHLLPYKGTAAVGYVADAHLVGFGKIAEAVDALARRLILQETLVHRLCDAVMIALAPLGAGVVITAEHGCMQVRGPMRRQSRITVEAWAGAFERDVELRSSLSRRAAG